MQPEEDPFKLLVMLIKFLEERIFVFYNKNMKKSPYRYGLPYEDSYGFTLNSGYRKSR